MKMAKEEAAEEDSWMSQALDAAVEAFTQAPLPNPFQPLQSLKAAIEAAEQFIREDERKIIAAEIRLAQSPPSYDGLDIRSEVLEEAAHIAESNVRRLLRHARVTQELTGGG